MREVEEKNKADLMIGGFDGWLGGELKRLGKRRAGKAFMRSCCSGQGELQPTRCRVTAGDSLLSWHPPLLRPP